MAATTATNKKRDVRIELQTADNGGIILNCSWTEDSKKKCKCSDNCGHPLSDYQRKQYVYDSLEDALKEIPGLISLKQDLDPEDDIDRKIMAEDKKEKY